MTHAGDQPSRDGPTRNGATSGDVLGEIRALLADQLGAAGLLPTPHEYRSVREDALALGKRSMALAGAGPHGAGRLIPALRSLHLVDAVAPRVLGFGAQQADGLALLAGVSADARSEVVRLGAVFNLAIALFDCVCDRFPARAALLLERVSPDGLEALLQGAQRSTPPTGDAAVDALVGLFEEFFDGCLRLGGDPELRAAFEHAIRAMYRAERLALGYLRERTPPNLSVLRALRSKSALPLATVGLLALLARGAVTDRERMSLRTVTLLAGEALWIVDDLADVREDFEAGIWSRPLWIHARMYDPRARFHDAPAAIRALLDSGIAAAEARRLAQRLDRLRRTLTAPRGQPFLRSIQASIQSWIHALPRPSPPR